MWANGKPLDLDSRDFEGSNPFIHTNLKKNTMKKPNEEFKASKDAKKFQRKKSEEFAIQNKFREGVYVKAKHKNKEK